MKMPAPALERSPLENQEEETGSTSIIVTPAQLDEIPIPANLLPYPPRPRINDADLMRNSRMALDSFKETQKNTNNFILMQRLQLVRNRIISEQR